MCDRTKLLRTCIHQVMLDNQPSLRKLREWLGRIIRGLLREVPSPDLILAEFLASCEHLQKQQPTNSKKLYSLHDKDVQYISKGKARQRCEFGQKMMIATSNRGN
jgi:transposase, IS5 family